MRRLTLLPFSARLARSLVLAPLLLAGCKWAMVPWVMWGEEPTKTVRAEFPHLEGWKVCVAVWAERDAEFEYPFVRMEVASYVGKSLQERVKGARPVDADAVYRYQNRDPDWDRRPPADIGRHFDAERVLLIELAQYTVRSPESPHLLRGYITGTAKVYDATKPGTEPLYSTDVRAVHPPDGPGAWGTSEDTIRREAMELFAEELVGKFYDRKVKVK
jgi:hypothetical protein